QVSREQRKNSTPCSLKGLRQSNLQKVSFGVPLASKRMRCLPSIKPAAFVKVLYRQTASDNIVRQFRYYLLAADAPEIALRFREAVIRLLAAGGLLIHPALFVLTSILLFSTI